MKNGLKTLMLIIVSLLIACNEIINETNSPPTIIEIRLENDSLTVINTETVICEAEDEDGDSLNFLWSAIRGTITGNGNEVIYRAPDTPGTDTISCSVIDNKGGGDISSISIVIINWILGTLVDIDGKEYKTVQIGYQEWMAENLRVTHYRNGDEIPTGFTYMEWHDLTGSNTGAFENDPLVSSLSYGLLYNYYAVADTRGIAPEGWHIPTDEEWKELESYLGMSDEEIEQTGYRGNVGGKLKSTSSWVYPNEGATNESGFNALPSGLRDPYYSHLSDGAFFYTSSEIAEFIVWYRHISSGNSSISRNTCNKYYGMSIRCAKD